MNLTIPQALRSKTVLAGLGLIVLQNLQFLVSPDSPFHLTPQITSVINLFLGAVAVYGRMRPTQPKP